MSSIVRPFWTDLTAAIRRAFYRWCLNRTTAQLAAAREQLDEFEDLFVCFADQTTDGARAMQEELINRRLWVDCLLDERAYLESKLAEQSA